MADRISQPTHRSAVAVQKVMVDGRRKANRQQQIANLNPMNHLFQIHSRSDFYHFLE